VRVFHDAADVALLCVARLFALAALSCGALAAARRGLPRPPPPPPRAAAAAAAGAAAGDYVALPGGPPGDEEAPAEGAAPRPAAPTTAPPLPATATPPPAAPPPADYIAAACASAASAGDKGARKRAKRLAKASADRAAAAADDISDALGRRVKSALTLTSTLLTAASQVYLGAKAVALPPSSRSQILEALLLAALVLAAHAEAALASAAVDAAAAAAWARARQRAASADGSSGAAAAAPATAACHVSSGVLHTDAGPVQIPSLSAGHYLRWCMSLAAPHRRLVLAGGAALLLSNACDLAVPRVAGAALDAAAARDGRAFREALARGAGLQAAAGAAGGVRGLCFATAAAHLLAALSQRLYRALLRQDIAFYDASSTGDLLSRLTEDAKAATEPANWIMSALGRAALQAAGGAAMCAHLSWRLTLLSGAALGPVYALTSQYAQASRRLQKARAEAAGAAAGAAAEALAGVRLVRACGAERAEASRYASASDAARSLGVADARAYALTVALNDWVNLAAQLVLLAAGGHLVMAGQMSVGELVAFQTYFGRIDASWQAVLQFLQSLTAAAGSAERVLSVLELRPSIGADAGGDDEDDAAPAAHAEADADAAHEALPAGPLSVSFDDVSFTYQLRPGARVLDGVRLSVAPGTTAALVGRSGSGKSTMVALLMRFYDPQAGAVRLGGVDVRHVAPAALRARVALVAQDAPLFACSIEANMAYGLPHAYTQAELRDAAQAANALEFVAGFEHGFATVRPLRAPLLSRACMHL
jgi:ATP-binding cassette subfamily B protein